MQPWGQGGDGVKKAHQQEYTSLDGQNALGNFGGTGFCPPGKVPESGTSGCPAMWPPTDSPLWPLLWSVLIRFSKTCILALTLINFFSKKAKMIKLMFIIDIA